VGTLSWIVVLLGISALKRDQISLAYLLAALGGLGIATAYVIPWSMVPDLIEYDELGTGRRREGSYYAFASFFQKLATGTAIWAMGQALALTGYITPEAGNAPPAQPAQALSTIRFFMGPVPAVLLAVAILFAWRYPISRERHRALRDQLAARES
jgi:GPH family glycoside/pentoside/hexuronide:cation symporter